MLLLLGTLFATSASAAEIGTDYSGGAFQILAPGAEGGFFIGPFSTDQGTLYDALTPLQGKVNAKKLELDYLNEKFGVQGSVLRTEATGKAGLEILRDSHDIPHVYGANREDVMFGSGWVAAEDRGLLLALGLGPAFAAADDVPGINPFGLLLQARSFTPSAETFKFVAEQEKVLFEQGPKGEQVLKDLENWAEGINAYEASLGEHRLLPPVNVVDAIAGFAFIGSIFGNGGGGEVGNSQLLANLQSKFGEEDGLKVFRDLKEVNDPEAPTTATTPFPYDTVPTGPTPGAAVIDPGSASSAALKAETALKASRRKASNFLLAGSGHTANGHPVAVMGPQLGYFYPEIVMQADLHGGGIDAQGVIAPISPYVFIGRGRDFAWSLTSAGSENTQDFLEQLCNPDEETEGPPTRKSTHYLYKGECIALVERDAGELGAHGSEPAREIHFMESVHGPIQGTVTVKGAPYAIAKDRATRGREPAGELAFSEMDSNEVHGPQSFFEAANHLETTFNMAYLDGKNIAYFSTGRLPVLAPGTDPSLPTFGTGEYDWKGFLTLEQHPHEVDPAKDVFTNWNNKPAPEWGAASDNYSYGPVHRVQLYTGFTTGMTEASDASIMNRAALQDLPALKDWPIIREVLAHGSAPSALAQEVVNSINSWVEAGASRLGTVEPKAAGAAAMDAVWTPIGEAVLSPVLGNLLPEFRSMVSPDDAPSAQGSAYDSGWYGYVSKDLRSVLGQPVEGAFSRGYCGGGELSSCAQSLWTAIQSASEAEEAIQKGREVSKWRANKVRITFPPGLIPRFTMRWTNRSTFQQVIEFTGHEGPYESLCAKAASC
ncbi:MAG TPA: penicillin acylase family protein [Solirubrobacteraceae bacterium]|nr:penicillin acylase family protein [Solirubrobacteraceae bacterium]